MTRVTPLQVWIISLVLSLIAGLLVFFLLIRPAQDRLATETKRYEDQEAIALTRPKMEQDKKNALREVAEAKAKWAIYDKKLMPNINITNLFTGMQELWQEQIFTLGPKVRKFLYADKTVQVAKESIALPAPPTDPNSIARKVFVFDFGQVEVVGNFNDVLNHVERWNTFDRLMVADNLTLQGNSPRLSGQYTLTCYEFTRGDVAGAPWPAAGTGTGAGGAGGFRGGAAVSAVAADLRRVSAAATAAHPQAARLSARAGREPAHGAAPARAPIKISATGAVFLAVSTEGGLRQAISKVLETLRGFPAMLKDKGIVLGGAVGLLLGTGGLCALTLSSNGAPHGNGVMMAQLGGPGSAPAGGAANPRLGRNPGSAPGVGPGAAPAGRTLNQGGRPGVPGAKGGAPPAARLAGPPPNSFADAPASYPGGAGGGGAAAPGIGGFGGAPAGVGGAGYGGGGYGGAPAPPAPAATASTGATSPAAGLPQVSRGKPAKGFRPDPFVSYRIPAYQKPAAYNFIAPLRLASRPLPIKPAPNPDPNIEFGPLPYVPRRVAGILYGGAVSAILEQGQPGPGARVDVVQPGSKVPSGIPGINDLTVTVVTPTQLTLRAEDGRTVDVVLSAAPSGAFSGAGGGFGNGGFGNGGFGNGGFPGGPPGGQLPGNGGGLRGGGGFRGGRGGGGGGAAD